MAAIQPEYFQETAQELHSDTVPHELRLDQLPHQLRHPIQDKKPYHHPIVPHHELISRPREYFFIAEREDVIQWAKKVAPDPIVKRMSMVVSNLKRAVGGYFKAQFKIMGVVFVILLVGFVILGINFNPIVSNPFSRSSYSDGISRTRLAISSHSWLPMNQKRETTPARTAIIIRAEPSFFTSFNLLSSHSTTGDVI